MEEFLQRVPGFQSTMALRWLLAREMDLRKAAGESIDLEEFQARFPQQRQDVEVAHQLHCQRRMRVRDGGRSGVIVNWCKCWIAT